MYYVGLDFHKEKVYGTVIDEKGILVESVKVECSKCGKEVEISI